MTNDKTEEAIEDATRGGRDARGVEAIVHEIARTIEAEGNTRAIFGAPVKLDTHTIIPVAALEIGMGAGGGMGQGVTFERLRDAAADAVRRVVPGGRGVGGGGGLDVKLRPVGFLHEEDGKVVFTPIPVASAHDGHGGR